MTTRTPTPPPLDARLQALLRRMRLPHVRRVAPEVLATAKAQRWDPAEVLRVLLAEEVAGRDRSSLATRRARAGFPTGKTFDAGDQALSSIPPPTQAALRTLEWISRSENLVVCGPAVIRGSILKCPAVRRSARFCDRWSVVSRWRRWSGLLQAVVRVWRVHGAGRGSRRGLARGRRAVPGLGRGAAA